MFNEKIFDTNKHNQSGKDVERSSTFSKAAPKIDEFTLKVSMDSEPSRIGEGYLALCIAEHTSFLATNDLTEIAKTCLVTRMQQKI